MNFSDIDVKRARKSHRVRRVSSTQLLRKTLARASEVAARSRKERNTVSSSDFFTQPGLGDVNMTTTRLPANRKIDQCGDDIVMFGVDQEFSE